MKIIIKRKFEMKELTQIFKKTIRNLVLYKTKDWNQTTWTSSPGKIKYEDKDESFTATISKKN